MYAQIDTSEEIEIYVRVSIWIKLKKSLSPGISAREYCFMPKQNELVPERTTTRSLCYMDLGPAEWLH